MTHCSLPLAGLYSPGQQQVRQRLPQKVPRLSRQSCSCDRTALDYLWPHQEVAALGHSARCPGPGTSGEADTRLHKVTGQATWLQTGLFQPGLAWIYST